MSELSGTNSLLDILPRDLVVLNFYAKDKQDALHKIADLFFEKKVLLNKEKFYENLLARESVGSTGVGKGIAVPYGISDTKKNIVIGLLISKEGIDFESLDKKPTFIIAPITGQPAWMERGGLYLKRLAQVSRFLDNSDIIEKLKKSESVDDVYKIIRKYEKEEDIARGRIPQVTTVTEITTGELSSRQEESLKCPTCNNPMSTDTQGHVFCSSCTKLKKTITLEKITFNDFTFYKVLKTAHVQADRYLLPEEVSKCVEEKINIIIQKES